jgi:RES domain-containing protein
MAKLPEPPRRLTIPAAVRVLPEGTTVWRIYFASGPTPTTWQDFRWFGPTSSRFDHHESPARIQTRGILYGAPEPVTCLAEVFQSKRTINRSASSPWLVAFTTERNLRLLDLMGTWPTRAGASMAIGSGPRPKARRWSRAVYEAYPDVEGLWYASSMHANRPALALYERGRAALPAAPLFHRALSDAALLHRLSAAAITLGYRLL